MIRLNAPYIVVVCICAALLSGCQSNVSDQILSSHESQVQLRNYQTKAFDTQDKSSTMRSVISTLQDLGFVLEKADQTLGTITASKFVGNEDFRISVTVREKGNTQMLVRANAQYHAKTVDNPQIYQDFFASLSKSMFLAAHDVG
jgi:hypothetical protein